MNIKTQYSIIGGSAGAFVLVLIILLLPQGGAEPIPIIPIGEQIISNETSDDGASETDDISVTLGALPAPPPPEQIVIEDEIEIIPIPESTTSSVRSGGSGGGGGSSSNGHGDDNSDESFMVIPESPIGVIALLGTAIATFGAYAYIKRH